MPKTYQNIVDELEKAKGGLFAPLFFKTGLTLNIVRNFILILLLCMGFSASALPAAPEPVDMSSVLALDDPFEIGVTNCGTNIPVVRLATVGQLTGGMVTCAWNPSPSSSVTGYYVYVDLDPITNYTDVFYDAGTNVYYTIANLNRGLTNYLAVTAYNDAGESPVSSNIWILAPRNYLSLVYSNSVSFTNVFYGSDSPSNYGNYTYTPPICYLSFVSDPFRIYTLLWTTNFFNWKVLKSYTNYPNQVTTFTDTNLTMPQKFYSLQIAWP